MSFFRPLQCALVAALIPVLSSAQEPAAPAPKSNAIPWDLTDLGPFQAGTFKFKLGDAEQVTAKGIAIKVGGDAGATVLFDTELLRWTAGWTGGFITFPRGRGGLEGQIKPAGEVQFSTPLVPGWGGGADPRTNHQGNLDPGVAKWRGVHVHGNDVILSYSVGTTPILDVAGFDSATKAFTRTISAPGTKSATSLLIAESLGSTAIVAGDGTARIETSGQAGPARTITIAAAGLPSGAQFEASLGRVSLKLPATPGAVTFGIAITAGPVAPKDLVKSATPKSGLDQRLKGGPARWGEAVVTQGKLSDKDGAYVIDEIPLPEAHPSKSWLRPGGHDFFPDGKAALVNLSGDVWLVDGLDEKLERVTWKRFATGLFQPLGCKIVDGKIYVLGRDQITRLHDLNQDGEADFYESFNNDCVATDNYHEFAMDLQTDSAGNFYYAKGSPWTPTATTPHQGCLLRVSKDGKKLDIIATGLRAPNGLGISPKDVISCSDNQGHWIPANRLNLIRAGGFYGMVPAAHRELTFTRADGSTFKANPSLESARKEFKTQFWGAATDPIPTEVDEPLVWLPMNVDNSPGGEVWVPEGGKWGPLAGQMLHLSYGHCLLYNVLQETVGGVTQGAVVKLAGKFPSGIMRGRFSPKDGQLYATGLSVWQSDAAKTGCFSRVRYTGKVATQPVGIRTLKTGIEVTFSAPLDEESAQSSSSWSVERWNYRWTGAYGSRDYSVLEPAKPIKDLVFLNAVKLSPDKKTVTLELPDMAPANQVKISFRIKAADGRDVNNEIYQTIVKVP